MDDSTGEAVDKRVKIMDQEFGNKKQNRKRVKCWIGPCDTAKFNIGMTSCKLVSLKKVFFLFKQCFSLENTWTVWFCVFVLFIYLN